MGLFAYFGSTPSTIHVEPEPDLDRLIDLKSIASRNGGSEVDLEITNNTRVALIYYWVRSDGSLQRYGILRQGARATLNTYVGMHGC